MISLINLVITLIDIVFWLIIASAIISWLVAFGIINTRNQMVSTVVDMLYRLTEPILAPFRRIIPSISGLDISPVVALLILSFIRNLIIEYGFGLAR